MGRFLITSLVLAMAVCLGQTKQDRSCEVEGCQVCSEVGECMMCEPGHMLQINKDNGSKQCLQASCDLENCARCLSRNLCALCQSGFTLDLNSRCAKNNFINEEEFSSPCLKKSSEGVCQECKYGYYLSVGSCQPVEVSFLQSNLALGYNIPNCNNTYNGVFCASCNSPFVVNSIGQCISNCSIQNCLLCSTSLTCATCQNGYVLVSNTCMTCNAPGCLSCISNNNCTSCANGYTLNTNTTTGNSYCSYTGWTIQYPCSQIENGRCIQCYYPFNPSVTQNSQCSTCNVAYCAVCNTTNLQSCTSCVPGFVLSSGVCNPPQWSPFCNQNNGSNCLNCIDGYYLSQNSNVCIPCPSTCTNCVSNGTCLSCMTGYYLNNGTCSQCISGCSQCTTDDNCVSFFVGLPLTDSNPNFTVYYAYTCDAGCYLCAKNLPSSCIQCQSGFALNTTFGAGFCVPCQGNCSSCNPSNTSQCYSCYNNAYYNSNSNTCTYCTPSSGCLTCSQSNANNCTSCPFGSYLSASSSIYICISSCPNNCLTCSSSKVCTSCETGYGLTTNGSCLPCMANCRTCSGQMQSICIQCNYGFSFDSERNCKNCSVGCSSCSPLGCIACGPGFTLYYNSTSNSNLCQLSCQAPCLTCNLNNPTSCTNCIFGYTLVGTVCTPHCPTVTVNNTNLTYCGQGITILPGGNQTNCNGISSCSRCYMNNGSTVCLSCMTGFYLTGNTCSPCPKGCSSCSSSTNCLSCNQFYTNINQPISINQLICQPCAAPCLQCYNTPDTCLSCISGFTFTGWNCVSNFYYIYNVVLGVSQTNFFLNYQAFIGQLTFAMQTQNMKAINVISVTQNNLTGIPSTQVSVNLTTLQTFNSNGGNAEYQNLLFVLQNKVSLGGMPVNSANVTSNLGTPPNPYSSTPTIVGIVVPIGVMLVVGFAYYICSRGNMDMPGAYVDISSTARDTELKAL